MSGVLDLALTLLGAARRGSPEMVRRALLLLLAADREQVRPAAAGSAAGWFGLRGPDAPELRSCAASEGGGPCAAPPTASPNITLLEPVEHLWWNGSTTGAEICARLGQPTCTAMTGPLQGYLKGESDNFGCKKLKCDSAVECSSVPEACRGQFPKGRTYCRSDPSPGQCLRPPQKTCPPCAAVPIAATRLTMCGAEPGPKLCMSCSGECTTCTVAPPRPQPGATTTPGWQGCLTALAKSLPCKQRMHATLDRRAHSL